MQTEIQHPPQGDRRYRVHRSAKIYVGHLSVGTVGSTWVFDESAERVVYLFPGGTEKVRYRNRFYSLQPAEKLLELAKEQFAAGGAFNVGGRYIPPYRRRRSFDLYEFIDVTLPEDYARAMELREATRASSNKQSR